MTQIGTPTRHYTCPRTRSSASGRRAAQAPDSTTNAVGLNGEVSCAENCRFDQVQHRAINDGPHWLHAIERKCGISATLALAAVQNTYGWIETFGHKLYLRPRDKYPVRVVQHQKLTKKDLSELRRLIAEIEDER
jgi:hypothetical protein